jgi:hypothetical protein
MAKRVKVSFNEKNCAINGLKIAQIGSNKCAESVLCRLCITFERLNENADDDNRDGDFSESGRKDKRTTKAKYVSPFRT